MDVAVSPDGNNVYTISASDDAIAEFARKADGSLAEIGCIADSSDERRVARTLRRPPGSSIHRRSRSARTARTFTSLPEDNEEVGDIAEFTRDADGSLTPIRERLHRRGRGRETAMRDRALMGSSSPMRWRSAPTGTTSTSATTKARRSPSYAEPGRWLADQPGGADDCIQDASTRTATSARTTASGLSDVTGVAVSPHGNNVYTIGLAERRLEWLDRGVLAWRGRGAHAIDPNDCLGNPEDDETCGAGVTGLIGTVRAGHQPRRQQRVHRLRG